VVGLTLLGSVGCGKREGASAPAGPPPLARVGDGVITEKDFELEARRRAEAGRPATDKSALLQDMIQREVMLQKAKSDDSMKDPEVQRSLENQVLTHWLDGTLQQAKNHVTVNDDELRAAYEADLASHTRPATIRVAMLYRKVNASDAPEERENVRAALLAARDAYLRDPAAATQGGRISGFGALAADASEDAVSRYRGGDIGWHQPGQESYRWPKPVMEAAFALNRGKPSEVIEFEDGLYVVMKSDERPAFVTPFEEAKVTMRRRMIRDKQAAVESQFRSNLMSSVRIEINHEILGRMELPRGAASEKPALAPAASGLEADPAAQGG
jgi:peptidyl-prolyl cis-trans isomerase C